MSETYLTLDAFLLARAEEDRDTAQRAIAQRNAEIAAGQYRKGYEPRAPQMGADVWEDWTGGPGISMGAERLLADAEAKIKIVELWAYWDHGTVDHQMAVEDLGYVPDPMRGYVLEQAMWLLAQAYTEHPDFNPEWEPS